MITPFRDGEDELPLSVVASRKKVSLRTIHRWRSEGKLACSKLGGRYYTGRDDWNRFVEACNGVAVPSDRPQARTAAQRRRDDEAANKRCIEMGC